MSALAMLGVCLALAAAPGAPPRFVPTEAFTLAWTHSIEKIRWEEDYSVGIDGRGVPVLIPGHARIRGSGAGMEPPPDAMLQPDGWYEYLSRTPPLHALPMARSPYTPDYEWCVDGHCEPMSTIIPTDGGVTLLRPCREPRAAE